MQNSLDFSELAMNNWKLKLKNTYIYIHTIEQKWLDSNKKYEIC